MSPSAASGAHENDSPLLRSSAACVDERREEEDFLGDLDLTRLGARLNPGGGGVPWMAARASAKAAALGEPASTNGGSGGVGGADVGESVREVGTGSRDGEGAALASSGRR
jgi:hypothetical protein